VPARRLRLAAACLAPVTLAGAACGGADPAPGDAGTKSAVVPSGPTTLQPASASGPAGTTRVTCDLATDDGPVRFALDLPDGFRQGATRHDARDSTDCVWNRPVRIRDASGPSYTAVVLVAVGYVRDDDERQTLSDVYDDESVNAVEGDTPQGDDSILHLDLTEDVPVLGATVGDRLSYWCYCDGQNTIARYAQAAGVRVQWSSVRELEHETDEQLAAALSGAGVVP